MTIYELEWWTVSRIPDEDAVRLDRKKASMTESRDPVVAELVKRTELLEPQLKDLLDALPADAWLAFEAKNGWRGAPLLPGYDEHITVTRKA